MLVASTQPGPTHHFFFSSQRSRALARVLISGYVDAYALLNFGVFASFMTGNTTTGGVHVGQGNLAAAGHSLLPIPFFLFGILAGTLLVHADRKTDFSAGCRH